ncbi:hypothetical protein DV736_g460, partial [Chaetothyriales sp. CBS 134916]
MTSLFARFGPGSRTLWPSSSPVPSLLLRRFQYQYASKTTAGAPGLRSSSKPLPSQSIPRPTRAAESAQGTPSRQQYRVNEMYSRGVRNVYTSPSHVGMLSFSWLLGTMCLAEVALMGTQGHWDMGDQMTGWQKQVTEAGNRLGLIFFGVVGWYCLFKYSGLVRSIDLVKKNGNALVSLKVRRFMPLWKPREIILAASDISLPPYWLHELDELSLDSGDVRRRGSFNLGKIMWIAFVRFRAWVFRYGIVDLRYNDESKRVLLDLGGHFSNRGADLWELTSTSKTRLPLS